MLSRTPSNPAQLPPQYPTTFTHTASPPLPLQTQSPYAPLTQTLSQPQPDFTFDNDMSFLDSFPLSDANIQGGWADDFDMGLAGWDGGGGEWSGGGGRGVDMFDGFFFGEGGVGNGSL